MKKMVSVMFASLILASCNGEDNNSEVEESVYDAEVEETEDIDEADEQESEDNDETDDESESEANVETDDESESDRSESETDEETSESDEESSDITHKFDGNSYYLNIQYQGILDPFGTLIFEDGSVTLEQNDTFEGEYSLDGNIMDIQVSNDDMSYHIVLDINASDSELVVDGTVEKYEIEGGDFSDEEQEVIDELEGNNFMMTKQ